MQHSVLTSYGMSGNATYIEAYVFSNDAHYYCSLYKVSSQKLLTDTAIKVVSHTPLTVIPILHGFLILSDTLTTTQCNSMLFANAVLVQLPNMCFGFTIVNMDLSDLATCDVGCMLGKDVFISNRKKHYILHLNRLSGTAYITDVIPKRHKRRYLK